MNADAPAATGAGYRIRAAVAADLDALVAFTLSEALEAEERSLNPPDARRGVAAAFATPPKARYWVVETNGQPVAATSIVTEWSNFRGGDYWWIQSLYIVPGHRGRGLVDLVLAHLVQAATAARALDLRLYGHDSNARALRAYQRFGFRPAPYLILTRTLDGP